MHTKIHHAFLATLLLTGFVPRTHATTAAAPYERDLVITAYYSPLDGQCCYVRGSLEDDVTLNGRGTNGADGTPVYPGMAAAPKSYAFGTRISLPGIGTVTVHDRGGAIIEGKDTDRLDLWMGTGEEGLARALEFGVRRVRATVYPPSTAQPAEALAFADFAAPAERVKPYLLENVTLMDVRAAFGDHSASVAMLQKALRSAGYDPDAKGAFGEATRSALRAFIDDAGLSEPDDRLTPATAAYLVAFAGHEDDADRLRAPVRDGSSAPAVRDAKEVLRTLGRYAGTTEGTYDETMRDAVTTLQLSTGVIADPSETGAGQIGPKTLAAINRLWRMRSASIDAEETLALRSSPFGTQVREALVAYRSR